MPHELISNYSFVSKHLYNYDTNAGNYNKRHYFLFPSSYTVERAQNFPGDTTAIKTLRTHTSFTTSLFLLHYYKNNINYIIKKDNETPVKETSLAKKNERKILFTGNISDFNLFSGNSSGLKSLDTGQQAFE